MCAMKNKLGVYNHVGFFNTYAEAYETIETEYRYQKTLRDSNIRVYRCRSHRGHKCNATVKIVVCPDGRFEVGKRFQHSHSTAIFENKGLWERHGRKWVPPEISDSKSAESASESDATSENKDNIKKKAKVEKNVEKSEEKAGTVKEYRMKQPRGPRGPYKKKKDVPPPPSEELSLSEHSINLLLQSLQEDLNSSSETSDQVEQIDVKIEKDDEKSGPSSSEMKDQTIPEIKMDDLGVGGSNSPSSNYNDDLDELEERNAVLMKENSELMFKMIRLKRQLRQKCQENKALTAENIRLKSQLDKQ
ncbi:unnamed protein product [Bursaphelenchus xylophilus]|uniref:(pine wood nematode) hypothetical protein n=1 Tax=Bursaphelenchus xylophilus TaxID=6326 RepID=A0A7I8WZ44_BURXY|nr:unnamed protein product [Bursaphelenchus xylophilus]CAG9101958.1 unnamed protein product [Bursaphelenchus xylophilus]